MACGEGKVAWVVVVGLLAAAVASGLSLDPPHSASLVANKRATNNPLPSARAKHGGASARIPSRLVASNAVAPVTAAPKPLIGGVHKPSKASGVSVIRIGQKLPLAVHAKSGDGSGGGGEGVGVVEGQQRGVHLDVMRAKFAAKAPASPADITIALQGDVSRLFNLDRFAVQWKGPISCAVLCTQDTQSRVDQYMQSAPDSVRQFVTLHVVVADAQWGRYPINFMRNVALDNVASEYVYIIDIDEHVTAPMADHRHQLDQALSDLPGADKTHTAFVVSSWQWATDSAKQHVPTDKAQLVALESKGLVAVKHPEWTKAYLSPALSFEKWKALDHVFPVRFSESYEPYYIANAKSLPRFDARFSGFGGNAAAQTLAMAFQSFDFVVLPTVFNFADETPGEALSGHKPGDQDVQSMDRAWKELGARHGCPRCAPARCVDVCPGSFKAPLVVGAGRGAGVGLPVREDKKRWEAVVSRLSPAHSEAMRLPVAHKQ